MKTNIRARRNAGRKARVSQAATSTDKPSAKNPTSYAELRATAIKHGSKFPVLLFAEHNGDDEYIGGMDLSRAEFDAIQQDAAARGETLDAWWIRTLDSTPALQSLKDNVLSTETQPESPRWWRPELTLQHLAVVKTLIANTSGLSLTVEAITSLLPRFCFRPSETECSVLLADLERYGKAGQIRGGWVATEAGKEWEQEFSKPPEFKLGHFDELQAAIDQAQALSSLLEHQLEHPTDGTLSDRIQNGIAHLSLETFGRLQDAADRFLQPSQVKGGAR